MASRLSLTTSRQQHRNSNAALRKYDVHEDIITDFRCNRTGSQAVFIALDRTTEGQTETLKEAFGVDAS